MRTFQTPADTNHTYNRHTSACRQTATATAAATLLLDHEISAIDPAEEAVKVVEYAEHLLDSNPRVFCTCPVEEQTTLIVSLRNNMGGTDAEQSSLERYLHSGWKVDAIGEHRAILSGPLRNAWDQGERLRSGLWGVYGVDWVAKA